MATVKIGAAKITQVKSDGVTHPFAELFGGAYYGIPTDGKDHVLAHIAKVAGKVADVHAAKHADATESFSIHFEGVFVDDVLTVQPATVTGAHRDTVHAYEQALLDAGKALLELGKAKHAEKAPK